uniref:Major facilitator superfamily (MFS) profile domain-containing protein n=1 Tax=Caenorhabditis japonica TaxID=281687 RepID=A0A8R1HN74_CAEJA
MSATTEEKKFLITPITISDLDNSAHANHTYEGSDPEEAEEADDVEIQMTPDAESLCVSTGRGDEDGPRSITPNTMAYEFIPLIYSEPALFNMSEIAYNLQKSFAASDTLLPHMRVVADEMRNASASNTAEPEATVSHAPSVLTVTAPEEKNMYQSDISMYGRQGHKPSFSTREIREQHQKVQQKYRDVTKKERKEGKPTDPIDFEGILNIIGGCRWWQIWIYVLIALQQIPHAMFNLNVVYMMYDPEFQCMVPGFNDTNDTTVSTNGPYLWGLDDIKNISLVFPNAKSDGAYQRDSCYFYERAEERYRQLRRMPLESAMSEAWKDVAPKKKCQAYHFEKDVMRETIVTDFNLVCDSWLAKGHAHMFYSIGYLLGCVLGGVASDRIGRKPTIIGFGILSSMFGVFLPFTDYYPMFLFIRLLSAICNEAADLAAYTLCMEITGTKYRAMVGSMLQAPWALGYALLALIAYLTKSWKTIQVIAAGLHFLSIIFICSIPESPRWLMVQNRVSEAEEVIRKACREPPFPFNMCTTSKCGNLPSDLELVSHRERKLNKKTSQHHKDDEEEASSQCFDQDHTAIMDCLKRQNIQTVSDFEEFLRERYNDLFLLREEQETVERLRKEARKLESAQNALQTMQNALRTIQSSQKDLMLEFKAKVEECHNLEFVFQEKHIELVEVRQQLNAEKEKSRLLKLKLEMVQEQKGKLVKDSEWMEANLKANSYTRIGEKEHLRNYKNESVQIMAPTLTSSGSTETQRVRVLPVEVFGQWMMNQHLPEPPMFSAQESTVSLQSFKKSFLMKYGQLEDEDQRNLLETKFLTGKARQVFRGLPDSEKRSVDIILNALANRLRISPEDESRRAKKAFEDIRYYEGQSIEDFCLQIDEIAVTAYRRALWCTIRRWHA